METEIEAKAEAKIAELVKNFDNRQKRELLMFAQMIATPHYKTVLSVRQDHNRLDKLDISKIAQKV